MIDKIKKFNKLKLLILKNKFWNGLTKTVKKNIFIQEIGINYY